MACHINILNMEKLHKVNMHRYTQPQTYHAHIFANLNHQCIPNRAFS